MGIAPNVTVSTTPSSQQEVTIPNSVAATKAAAIFYKRGAVGFKSQNFERLARLVIDGERARKCMVAKNQSGTSKENMNFIKKTLARFTARAEPAKLLARWFGANREILMGGVYSPANPERRFTIEFLEQREDGLKFIAKTIASRLTRCNEDIPNGYAFEFDVPEDWKDGELHQPVFRVVETGKLFPRKPLSYCHRGFSERWEQNLSDMIGFLERPRTLPVLLLVTHETTLTGGPMVALNVLKHVRATQNWICVVLSLAEHLPQLENQFREASDCFAAFNGRDEVLRVRALEFLAEKVPAVLSKGPVVSLVSTLGCHWVSPLLKASNIPSVWLVHEFAQDYPRAQVDEAFTGASQLVFASHHARSGYIMTSAMEAPWQDLCENAFVRPQGVLWRGRPAGDKSRSREELRSAFRSENAIPMSAFVVLCCGTVSSRKGVDWFLTFTNFFASSQVDIDIHFVWCGTIGDDEFGRRIADDIKRLRLDAKGVHFPGDIPDLESAYAAADLFLMCSRSDPLPNVVLEAAGRGLPILGFDQGQGTSDLIREYGFGSIVPYQDLHSTSLAIQDFKNDPKRREDVGSIGQKVIKTKFLIEDYADDIIKLLDSLLTSSPNNEVTQHNTEQKADLSP